MEPERLSDSAREIVFDGTNEIYLSAVSAWEVAIKYSRKRLELPSEPQVYIPERLSAFNFQSLDVVMPHATRVAVLPMHHRDPFDRLLVAQSQIERLPIITSDANIARYDVEVIW